ncbi:NHL repeat-containing protein [Kineococcus sp. SYSU DK005]|uniref:hypothetical protein n=1 Tax=Kineococcus sp. SYSU DK005 TaxID=3383126 RepID=UPI003D7ED998
MQTSWVANDAGGGRYENPEEAWVQHDVDDAVVTPDGTVYAATPWEEGTAEVGVYRDGEVLGRLADTHGWGRQGGTALAMDATRVFQAMQQDAFAGIDSPGSGSWYAVRVFDRGTREAVEIPGGKGRGRSMLVISTSSPVTALAVSGGKLFAGVAGQGTAITAVQDPSALAVDERGQLLVADDGEHQQVHVVDPASGRVEGSIGVRGGTVAPDRFNGSTGLGVDGEGRCTWPTAWAGTALRSASSPSTVTTPFTMTCGAAGAVQSRVHGRGRSAGAGPGSGVGGAVAACAAAAATTPAAPPPPSRATVPR